MFYLRTPDGRIPFESPELASEYAYQHQDDFNLEDVEVEGDNQDCIEYLNFYHEECHRSARRALNEY